MMKHARLQNGMALMTMIFILVIMGSALVYMARLSTQQTATTSLAVQSARGKQAALAGLNWAAYMITNNLFCTSTPDSETMDLTEQGLSGYQVAVACTYSDHAEGSNTVRIYAVEASAQYQSLGSNDYAFRKFSVVMEK